MQHFPVPAEDSKLLLPLLLGVGITKENTMGKHQKKRYFTYSFFTLLYRGDTARSAPLGHIHLSQLSSLPPPFQQLTECSWPACTSVVLQQKDPSSSSVESEILKARGLLKGLWHACLSRTKELSQGKIFSLKVKPSAQAVGLHLLVRRSPRLKAHSYTARACNRFPTKGPSSLWKAFWKQQLFWFLKIK